MTCKADVWNTEYHHIALPHPFKRGVWKGCVILKNKWRWRVELFLKSREEHKMSLIAQLYMSSFCDYFNKVDEMLVGQKYTFGLYL